MNDDSADDTVIAWIRSVTQEHKAQVAMALMWKALKLRMTTNDNPHDIATWLKMMTERQAKA